MRRLGTFLAATALLWTIGMPTAQAETVTKTVSVRMPGLANGQVVTTDPTHAMVNFGGPFESIQYIGFHVVMQGDLLDPGEALMLDSAKLGGRGVWPWGTPVSEFWFSPHPQNYHYWLDGHERIAPAMTDKAWDHDDSVRIVGFTATITGTR